MSRLKIRLGTAGTGLILALVTMFVLALPGTSSGQLPGAAVTVCQVTGSASAPNFLEVKVSVDKVAAYLNQYPGSFVGSCPDPGSGGGGSDNPPLNGTVTVCHVSGSAKAPILSEVLVSVDKLAAYLNQNPGSFVGNCPAADGGGNAGGGGGTGPLNAVVTVCRVTGSVNAPALVQLTLTVDQVVAFLNKNPGSFIGTCPGKGGSVTKPPGRILGIPVGAGLTICQVTTTAKALRFIQVNVVVDRVAGFLNQHPGSFVGLCPGSDDSNGTIGNEPLGYVTICRVTGDVKNPLAPITIRLNELAVYLTRAGTVVPGPTGGCRRSTPPDDGGSPPAITQPNQPETIVVDTTPNTVVTATGAGVKASTKSNKAGKAKLKIKAKKKGIITVRADGGRVVKRIGVASPSRSGANLTG